MVSTNLAQRPVAAARMPRIAIVLKPLSDVGVGWKAEQAVSKGMSHISSTLGACALPWRRSEQFGLYLQQRHVGAVALGENKGAMRPITRSPIRVD